MCSQLHGGRITTEFQPPIFKQEYMARSLYIWEHFKHNKSFDTERKVDKFSTGRLTIMRYFENVLYCRKILRQYGNKKCDRWIKIDQLDVTCFIISLFTAQHVSNVSTSIFRSLRLIVDLFHVLYCSGSMCVGVTVWFGWGGVVSLCRLKH
jgi:hypothetical protein